MIFCRSTRERGRGQKKHSIQDEKRNMQKESVAADKEMRKVREEIIQREERFLLLSKNVESNRMATAELEEKLRGLQAGEERRGSDASQVVECCLDTVAEQFHTVGAEKPKHQFAIFWTKRFSKIFEAPTLSAQMPGKEGREENEEEQEQRKASQQMGPPAPGEVTDDHLFVIPVTYPVLSCSDVSDCHSPLHVMCTAFCSDNCLARGQPVSLHS